VTKATKSNINLETALIDLEKLISEMEKGGLTLEKSLENFEKGISLIRQSQEILKSAEQKVQILINKNNQTILQSYEQTNEDE
jgi:exodeoxyribonuclease VII small subunit